MSPQKKAYVTIRKCCHRLDDLIAECQKRSCGRYKICSEDARQRAIKMDKIGVGVRYGLDVTVEHKAQTVAEVYTGTGRVSGIIANYEFYNAVLEDIKSISKTVGKIKTKRFGNHPSRNHPSRSKKARSKCTKSFFFGMGVLVHSSRAQAAIAICLYLNPDLNLNPNFNLNRSFLQSDEEAMRGDKRR